MSYEMGFGIFFLGLVLVLALIGRFATSTPKSLPKWGDFESRSVREAHLYPNQREPLNWVGSMVLVLVFGVPLVIVVAYKAYELLFTAIILGT